MFGCSADVLASAGSSAKVRTGISTFVRIPAPFAILDFRRSVRNGIYASAPLGDCQPQALLSTPRPSLSQRLIQRCANAWSCRPQPARQATSFTQTFLDQSMLHTLDLDDLPPARFASDNPDLGFRDAKALRDKPHQLGICRSVDRRRREPDLDATVVLSDNLAPASARLHIEIDANVVSHARTIANDCASAKRQHRPQTRAFLPAIHCNFPVAQTFSYQ
jgi:hypothetical protein